MIPIEYCYGLRDTDNHPTTHRAPDFDSFAREILSLPRARVRERRTYICGPLKANGVGTGHRCKADLLPRAWLALDLDGGSREDCDVVLMRLSDYLGVAWTTARSTPKCPRIRILVALTRLVDGREGERLGRALAGVVGTGLASLHWDPSTYKGEQECFLPMVGAATMSYSGEPVDVDALLALAPVEKERFRPETQDPFLAALARGGFVDRDLEAGKTAIRCLNEAAHTTPWHPGDTSTVYFWPNYGGYRWGRIHCSHAHCAEFNTDQTKWLAMLGLDPRDVWREQGRGPVQPVPLEELSPTVADEDLWPEPLDGVAYQGLAGEIVKFLLPETESDPAALLVQILTAYGALVGREAWYQVEATRHYPNFFSLLVGGTSKARKGTSWDRVASVFRLVDGWVRVLSGLSSGEGLKYQVRDARARPKKRKKMRHWQDPDHQDDEDDEQYRGVTDKRLLVIEPEFGGILRAASRPGNTLSGTLRQASETGDLHVCTRHDPIKATGAHICIVGHVTAEELRKEMSETDMANGFGNRFLLCCTRRSKSLPMGGEDLDEDVLHNFARRIAAAAGTAKGVGRIKMNGGARELWGGVYPVLSEPRETGLVGSMTARAEAHAVRWALAYALLDQKAEIGAEHLEAALGLVANGERAVRYVWPEGARGNPVVDDIRMRALRGMLRDAGVGGLTTSAIRDLFQRHVRPGELQQMLAAYIKAGFVTSTKDETTGGRPSVTWLWRQGL